VRISAGILVFLGLMAFLLMPARVVAQTTQELPIEDVLSRREFGQLSTPTFSSDQEWLVYTVQQKDLRPANSRIARPPKWVPWYAKGLDLYAVNTRTNTTRCLTGGIGDNWSPAWSPDGRYLAFLSDRDGSAVPKLWLWERSTGKLMKVSDVQVRPSKLAWLSQREIVITVPVDDEDHEDEQGSQPSAKPPSSPPDKMATPGPTVQVYRAGEELLSGTSAGIAAPWNLNAYRKDLAILDLSTGKVRRLTHGLRIAEFQVSPDRSQVAFSSPIAFENASQQIRWNLLVVSAKTGAMQTVATAIRLEYDGSPFSWSPDSSRLAYLSGGPAEHDSGTGDCFILDVRRSESVNATHFSQPPGREKQHPPLWGTSGKELYFIRDGDVWKIDTGGGARRFSTIIGRRIVELAGEDQAGLWSPQGGFTVALAYDSSGKQTGFYSIDLATGNSSRLQEDGRCYDCLNADQHLYTAGGDRIAFFAEDAGHDRDLWLADTAFRASTRLTHLNPKLDSCVMGFARLVRWRSLEGQILQGALLLPPHYQPEKRYPLIVWVYAGMNGADFLNHFGLVDTGAFNMQLLATRGYAVFFPDAPQGAATPMADIAKTVLPGINQLIEMGIADPARLGVMGQSYGGYSALALIVQTARFQAAVELDGPGNLISAYGAMDKDGTAFQVSNLEKEQGRMGGSPWQFRDRYIENSPYFYLDRVQSPLLIVQGGEDRTTAPYLADELFVALRRLGKKVEYAKYEGEGHSPAYWTYPNQLDYCRRMLAWFQQHLGAGKN
jgi:dipeptidyl aminopeptidase/acylaminoacyl peptidase